MMAVTLDTNVLISGSLWNGNSSTIITMIENKNIKLIIFKEILNEYICVLNYKEIKEKIKSKDLIIKLTIEKLISISNFVTPKTRLNIVEDSDDNKILECVFEGNMDYVITSDNHLLKLNEFNKIKIVTPEQFLRLYYAELTKESKKINDEWTI